MEQIWTIASIVAVLGLGLTLVIHIIKYSYQEGQKDARLASLEKHRDESLDGVKILIELGVTVSSLKETVGELNHTVRNMLQGKIQLPSQGRGKQSD